MAHHVQRTLIVHAENRPTWAAVSEMMAVHDWHPNVASVSLLSEHNSGIGASRRVHFHDGNSVVETITRASEGDYVSFAMTELPLLDQVDVTITLSEPAPGQTAVTFAVDYTLKYGPLGWLMNALVLRRSFKKIFGISLGGLAYHLESGELVVDSIPAAAIAMHSQRPLVTA